MNMEDQTNPIAEALQNAQKPPETPEQAIARLARLSLMEYEKVRKTEAEALGIDRVGVLDKEVEKARKPGTQENYDDKFPTVEAWPEPVNMAELLDEITAFIRQFIICAPETANASALWAAFTWVIDHVQVAPIAFITAPEMQCGKSQLLSVIGSMVKKPAIASSITPSVIFRVIEKYCPTLLIDEADSFMNGNEDLRGLINSGHTRQSAYVWRSVGEDHEPTQFSTWGAKVLCGIGAQAATIMDRSIILELRRKMPHEQTERLRHADKTAFLEIRQKLARFAEDAGGHWPGTARQTALFIYAKSKDEDNQSAGMMLLRDVQNLFDDEPTRSRITSAELLEKLCQIEDRPWSEWNKGRPITTAKIAKYLKPFGVTPKTMRDGYKVAKGYLKSDFDDAFSRYIPLQGVTPLQTASSKELEEIQTVTFGANVTPSNSLKPLETVTCNAVTLSAGESRNVEVF
jgi:putative DNA primase/helicase